MINYFKYLFSTKWKYISSTYIIGSLFLILAISKLEYYFNVNDYVFGNFLFLLILGIMMFFVFITTIYVILKVFFDPFFKSSGVFDYSLPISPIKKQITKIIFVDLYVSIGILIMSLITYIIDGKFINLINLIKSIKIQVIFNYIVINAISINILCIVCIILKPYIKTMFVNLFVSIVIERLMMYIVSTVWYIVLSKLYGLKDLNVEYMFLGLVNSLNLQVPNVGINYAIFYTLMMLAIMILSFFILEKVENKVLEI